MKWLPAIAAAGALALSGGGVAVAGATHPHRPPAARMLVYAQEWSLWPSRTSLPDGALIVQLWNRGQDAHDLHLRRVNRHGHMVGRALGSPVALSGQVSQASWTLRPGLYELYCSMPGHFARGMHVLLHVR
jgi:hypothetical protein